MCNASRFLLCLLAVLCLWHGEIPGRLLVAPLEVLAELLAPEWAVRWHVEAEDMTLALEAWPGQRRGLPEFRGMTEVLEARVPLRHLLPFVLALVACAFCLAYRGSGWRICLVALAAALPLFALVHGLGLLELSLAQRASAVGDGYTGSAWLTLMLWLEAGGR